MTLSTKTPQKNALNWFEIPAEDINRAKIFYGKLLDQDLSIIPFSYNDIDMKMVMLEYDTSSGVGGAIIQSSIHVPSSIGSIVYLNGGNDLQEYIDRVQPSGGTIVIPKTKINDDIGYFALFRDSEANCVGFHSRN